MAYDALILLLLLALLLFITRLWPILLLVKPLMHYSRRLAEKHGFEIRLLPYSGFLKKVKGDKDKMQESYKIRIFMYCRPHPIVIVTSPPPSSSAISCALLSVI